jgi:hypothetical protein
MTIAEGRHRRERRLMDRHFGGRATPAGETEMWAHLDGCEPCRQYYERHRLLAALDPAAPAAKARLAAGLGFSPAPRPRPWLVPTLTLAAAGAAALLLFAPARLRPEFAARGPGVAEAPSGPRLHIVRVLGPDRFAELGPSVRADDALAFAHVNAAGFPWLMVVGVDERGALYWFHPDPDRSDRSVPIAEGEGARTELGEAVQPGFGGKSLRILGLFSREPLETRAVESALDASGCEGLRARLPGVTCAETVVGVEGPR